ncbi:MAG TPA: hypothetical protein PLI18_01375 [Pirellulaceae bacterium]|nr:hypothetical protein [Pirellulaceae bacterium]
MLDDGEEIVGRLKRIVNQRVEIERENGTVVEVLKEQLSEEDRRFLDSIPRR